MYPLPYNELACRNCSTLIFYIRNYVSRLTIELFAMLLISSGQLIHAAGHKKQVPSLTVSWSATLSLQSGGSPSVRAGNVVRKLDWSVCICLTQLYDGRDMYRIYYIKNNYMFRHFTLAIFGLRKEKN